MRARRHGAITVQVVACLAVILGVAALAVDGGVLMDRRRQAQTAADAAALAAAAELFAHYPRDGGRDPNGTAADQARATAAANGCAHDGITCIVTVNVPPQSGAFTDPVKQPGCVEVIIDLNEERCFSAALGQGRIPLRARAVARGKWGPSSAGVLTLERSAADSLLASNLGSVTVSGGADLIVNSDSGLAADLNASGTVTVAPPGKTTVAGGWNGAALFSPVPVQRPALADPLRSLLAVNPAPLPMRTWPLLGGTIYPGRYVGLCAVAGVDVVLAGEGTPDPNNGNVPIPPGAAIYYFDGGPVLLTGAGNLRSTGGVLIYYAPSSPLNAFALTSLGNVNVAPLTAGRYAGMCYFQARGTRAPFVLASVLPLGASTLGGTVYAPDAPIQVTALGSLTTSQVIANSLSLTGTGNVNVDATRPRVNVRSVSLVE
jgi:hypothetical protein